MSSIQKTFLIISGLLIFLLLLSVHESDDILVIKNELAQMVLIDQALRSKINFLNIDESLIQEMHTVSVEHTAVLKRILNTYSWITISNFGVEADHQAWLLVQHADHDIRFQKKVLKLLAVLYPLHETSATHYAYLYDRVAKNEGRPQRYGTQGSVVNNKWVLYDLEDLVTVDIQRAKVGLQSLQEYTALVKKQFSLS